MRTSLQITLGWIATSLVLASAAPVIICPADAPPNVRLAAKEVRRYVYLRSGELARIQGEPANGPTVTMALMIDTALAAEQYRLKTTGTTLTIAGGSPTAVLYGAYDFAEQLGVRFYLHGDVIPDDRIPWVLPQLDETHQPLFTIRGIQPFHDFEEGPDWWNQDDYLAYLSQLAKMRMNFIGLHTYPEGNVGPEPLVWIGLPQDVNAAGTVKFSYPARWANTADASGWGYAAMKTSDFTGGAAMLFPTDDYGPEVQSGFMPWPTTPADCNELFNRVGRQFRTVFAEAKKLGIKTCLGTETPLTIPRAVREHLKELGKDANDPKVVRELYDGMFTRIATLYPADYYWLWTPEGWTWSGNNPAQFEATRRDIMAAYDSLQALGKPFTLATSGWVLGPQHDRAALDAFLPKECPMSCINRTVGHDPVEPAFANLIGRPKWAIPWMENDPNLIAYQPWAARMRHDAVDARRFGCDGLIGIHWRTKALAATVSALAGAAWDQSWVPPAYDISPVKPVKSNALGGQCVQFTAPVAGTDMPAVYQSVRYDVDGYSLQIPNGTYAVTLNFNEPHYTVPGKRVFGVKVQGQPLVDKLDLFATMGTNQAHDLKVPDVKVTDGTLKIDFIRVVEFPCIAGIVVAGMTAAGNQVAAAPFSRKINCGGPPVADYEGDQGNAAAQAYASLNGPPDQRAMPSADFYQDFARAQFGASIAAEAGRILAAVDGPGSRPNPADWKNGPGNLYPTNTTSEQLKIRFEHVGRFAALRSQVTGAGNLERFDYWHNTLRLNQLMCELDSLRGQLDTAVGKIVTEKEVAARKQLAENAVAVRLALVRKWDEMMTAQIAIVSTPGELGTIANLEQHNRLKSAFLTAHDPVIAEALGAPLPAGCAPAMVYTGPAKIIVPTVRSVVSKGEELSLKVIALNRQPVKSVTVRVRPLGGTVWQTIAAKLQARAVWQVTFPAAADDFEYMLESQDADGSTQHWPATAPGSNQTVIVSEQ